MNQSAVAVVPADWRVYGVSGVMVNSGDNSDESI
jgi:hypothetical protein